MIFAEIRKTPVKPCGKGSKRKQDDVALEDQQSWVEVLQEELPEQDDPNDATYEVSTDCFAESPVYQVSQSHVTIPVQWQHGSAWS